MSGLVEFIGTVLAVLEEANYPYIVTGSFASIAYSEPRTTQDIDFVVDIPSDAIEGFRSTMVANGFVVPGVHPEIDMFNVLDPVNLWKADIILWQDEPFDKERFARRKSVELLPGIRAYIATVEDMILAKLRWIQGRESALQTLDISSMIEFNRDELDLDYLSLETRLAIRRRS